jgi:hypothetical protein
VTLRELAPGDALRWMERSLGLPEPRDPRALLAAFDPSALPRGPGMFPPAC